jgi:hypothetical protein
MTSSIVPFRLAVENPDLIHVEWNRLSPISYGFQTAAAASALTCGIYDPVHKSVLYPKWDSQSKKFSFLDVKPSTDFYDVMNRKMVLHLTMTAARYYVNWT